MGLGATSDCIGQPHVSVRDGGRGLAATVLGRWLAVWRGCFALSRPVAKSGHRIDWRHGFVPSRSRVSAGAITLGLDGWRRMAVQLFGDGRGAGVVGRRPRLLTQLGA